MCIPKREGLDLSCVASNESTKEVILVKAILLKTHEEEALYLSPMCIHDDIKSCIYKFKDL